VAEDGGSVAEDGGSMAEDGGSVAEDGIAVVESVSAVYKVERRVVEGRAVLEEALVEVFIEEGRAVVEVVVDEGRDAVDEPNRSSPSPPSPTFSTRAPTVLPEIER
jgi:hypothetical protein